MPRFPRSPALIPSRAAERALFRTLELIAEENSTAKDFGRKASREAVHACWTYLHDRGLSGQALKALGDVIVAFEDVDRGVLPEIFDPLSSKRAGAEGEKKWSRSSAARQTQIYAAACLGALILKEVPKEEAAAKVARAAQSWPRFSTGIIKPSTVINWRDDLLQAASKDPARLTYEQGVRMFTQGRRAGEFFAEGLRDGPPLTGGKHKPKT